MAHATPVPFDATAPGSTTFTVTTTGTYFIHAYGAQGGNGADYAALTGSEGGLGATVGGDFFLTAGDGLNLIVGGRELMNFFDGGGGGGGGSFVFLVGRGASLIAGGGGGGGGSGPNDGTPVVGESGAAGSGTSVASAGTQGNAGAAGTGGNGGSAANRPVLGGAGGGRLAHARRQHSL